MDVDLIQRLITDFQQRELPSLVSRKLEITELRYSAVVITGARRSGKTYRTYQYIEDKLKSGTSSENICRLQFNDNRLLALSASELDKIDEAYYALFPDKLNREAVYFIFDEIHRIEGWENYVLRLLDNPLQSVLVTGSTSKLLSGDIASALRGKCTPHNLFPFSFGEYLTYHGVDPRRKNTQTLSTIKNRLKSYLDFGGFPGLFDLGPEKHLEMLQDYWDTMILKDIIEAHPNDRINIVTFTRFAAMLVSRNACPMTVRSLIAEMKEAGLKASPDTMYRYLRYLEEAFMVYTVPYYSKSLKSIDLNYRKVYIIDWALAHSISSGEGMSISRRFENVVFLQLRREYDKVSYYKTRQGFEVDFVVHDNKTKRPLLFQVTSSLSNLEVRNREFRAIIDSAKFLESERNTVISLSDEEEEVEIDGTAIRVIPAWKWLLNAREH